MVWRPWWWVPICAACSGIAAGILALNWLPWRWAIGAALAFTILLVALWAIWWWLPKQQANRLSGVDESTKAGVEDKFRKTVSQVLGGAAVIIGAFLTYYGAMQNLLSDWRQAFF